ncbi:MAG: NAD-dependent epimerase/dehydratase family protein, partial [Aristaeellaceae bacterium]
MNAMPVKTAVVNGTLGTVGSALVRCLLRHGVKTYAVVYPGADYAAVLPPEAEVVACDMRQLEQLPGLIGEKADAYFHLAWMGTIGPGR